MSLQDVAAALQTLREQNSKYDGKIGELGRDLGKIRSRIRGDNGAAGSGDPTTATGEPAATPTALTHDDLRAAMALGRIVAQLPEAAQRHLEQLQESGMSYSEAARMAEAMRISMSAGATPSAGTSGDPKVAPPPGQYATSAPRAAPTHPRSIAEYVALTKEQRAVLKNDPTFDPTALPRFANTGR